MLFGKMVYFKFVVLCILHSFVVLGNTEPDVIQAQHKDLKTGKWQGKYTLCV